MSVKPVQGGYTIDFTLDGQRYRETIPAPHTKAWLKRVQEQELIYQAAIRLNSEDVARKFPNSKIIKKAFASDCEYTIHEYSNIWFKQKQRNWSHTTIRGYSQKYNSYIKDNWGSLLLKDFKSSMFDEWSAKSHLSPKSINETRNVLMQIFERAFLDEVISKNPIKKVQRIKQNFSEPRPFSLREIDQILSKLKTPYRQFYEVAFFTGLRTGELLGLRWQDIDLKHSVAHIRVNITGGIEKEPKTKGSIRTIELHPNAVKALGEISQSSFHDPFRVFIDPRTLKAYKYADGLRKYIWKPALIESGVDYRYPYQTRHTYASMMLSEGKNPLWVAHQMGHADWGMIRKTYGRWLPKDN